MELNKQRQTKHAGLYSDPRLERENFDSSVPSVDGAEFLHPRYPTRVFKKLTFDLLLVLVR